MWFLIRFQKMVSIVSLVTLVTPQNGAFFSRALFVYSFNVIIVEPRALQKNVRPCTYSRKACSVYLLRSKEVVRLELMKGTCFRGWGSRATTSRALARVPWRDSWELSKENLRIYPSTAMGPSALPFLLLWTNHPKLPTPPAPPGMHRVWPKDWAPEILRRLSCTGLSPPASTQQHTIIKTLSWPHFPLQLAPHFSTPFSCHSPWKSCPC